MKTAEEILADAATLVERPEGWTQKTLQRGTAVCAVGALMMAARGYVNNWSSLCTVEEWAAREALVKEVGTQAVGDWNDAKDRTATEVATALRNAKRWLDWPECYS